MLRLIDVEMWGLSDCLRNVAQSADARMARWPQSQMTTSEYLLRDCCNWAHMRWCEWTHLSKIISILQAGWLPGMDVDACSRLKKLNRSGVWSLGRMCTAGIFQILMRIAISILWAATWLKYLSVQLDEFVDVIHYHTSPPVKPLRHHWNEKVNKAANTPNTKHTREASEASLHRQPRQDRYNLLSLRCMCSRDLRP